MTGLTRTALADALGISRRRVGQLEALGMPLSSVSEAREWRRTHIAPKQDAKKRTAMAGRTPTAPGDGAQGTKPADLEVGCVPPPPRVPEDLPDGPIDYAEARARREHFAAKLAEMEVEKVAGRLVERSAVEPAVFNAFRALRDRVMATPRRVAPGVAPLTDLREIEAVVAEELRRAFAEFERTFSEQLAARTAPAP